MTFADSIAETVRVLVAEDGIPHRQRIEAAMTETGMADHLEPEDARHWVETFARALVGLRLRQLAESHGLPPGPVLLSGLKAPGPLYAGWAGE